MIAIRAGPDDLDPVISRAVLRSPFIVNKLELGPLDLLDRHPVSYEQGPAVLDRMIKRESYHRSFTNLDLLTQHDPSGWSAAIAHPPLGNIAVLESRALQGNHPAFLHASVDLGLSELVHVKKGGGVSHAAAAMIVSVGRG